MNAVSKGCLQSLFLDNRPIVGNRQSGFIGLRLVDRQPKNSFDMVCLNILGAEDVRRVRAGPSIKHDNKTGTRRDNKTGTEEDNEAGTGGDDKTGTEEDNKLGMEGQNNKVGIGGRDNKAATGRRDGNKTGDPTQDNKAGIKRRDNKGVAEPVARAFYTRAQRLLHRIFLLVACSNTFLAFSSSESVIG